MPYFAANPLGKLTLKPGDAEAELNLCGVEADEALARIDQLLAAGSSDGPRSYHIRFDPPTGDGSETLFQPIGRHLLAARRAGRLQSCLPLADGAGYYIVLA